MLRPQKISLALGVLCLAGSAHAFEATTQTGPSVPCAVVENYTGDIEILDPSRTHTVDMGRNVGIPCGGWVSSDMGWALIRHRDGHDLRVGPHTFIEIPENSSASPDQVVLYHGEMFGSTEGGGGDLRIITANARVRLPRGNILVNYDPNNEDTQLVALDAPASLENRFESEKKVVIQPGESTSLNFKLLRVVPTFPKAVSVAALRDKLTLFRVNEKDASQAYEVAQARAERRLAATLGPAEDDELAKKATSKPDDDLNFKKSVSDRKIASEDGSSNYERHPADPHQPDEETVLKTHFIRKMTAGEDVGERILFPDKFHGKPRKINLTIEDPAAAMEAKEKKTEDKEKKKLIEELSQIHED